MSDDPQPEPETPAEAGNTANVTSVSGGVNLDAQQVSITGDVVGRDKITQTTITEEVAYNVEGLENPYLGLMPFTYDERDIYAGRDDEIDEAVARLTAPGVQQVLLFVTGASGSGKSSFVQAGLLPRLEEWYRQRNQKVKRAVFRPAHDPMLMFQDALSQLGKGVRQLSDLAQLDQINLIVIDQFEELFTQAEAGPRNEFAALLQALPPFEQIHSHFIVTLRADYLKELSEVRALWDVVTEGIVLRAMSEDSLRKAILKPLQAKHPDKRMEPELLASLTHDAAENVIYLPLLQVTLQELWEKGRLKRAAYSNLADAIKQRAETVYGFTDNFCQVPREPRTQADQDVILKIFLDLVQVSLDDDARRDVRRRQKKADLIADSRSRAKLIEDLVGSRLVSVTTEAHGEDKIEYVDIIHEALIREWGRLQQAIKDNRQQLRWRERFVQRLNDWQTWGRGDKGLLADVHLEEARQLRERDDILMCKEDAQAFLRRSEDRLEADLRHEREQTERLREALANARSRELARVAVYQQGVDPTQALLIAIEAAKVHPGFAAEDTLRRALLTYPQLAVLRGHKSAQFAPDGWRLVTASKDNTVCIWDAATGRELVVLRGHKDDVHSMQFAPDGRRVVTTSKDKTARIWDMDTGRELAVLCGHESDVNVAQFSSNAFLVVTASVDHTARIWDANSGSELAILHGHEGSVWSAQFAPDGRHLVTASGDGTARIWDVNTGQELAVLRGHVGSVTKAQFSPDGKRIVITDLGKTARLWDMDTRRELAALREHDDKITSWQFAPNGQRLVTASRDKTARLWDTDTGRELAVLRGHEDTVHSVQFAPDGQHLVTASLDKTARVWDADSGREMAILRGHKESVHDAQFAPDGRRVATASWDNTARIWDADTGQELAVLHGHEGPVWSAQFAPDGHHLLTRCDGDTVRLWNTGIERELAVLRGHEAGVFSAQFSPDGRCIVTTSWDHTARIWDADTGRELAVLHGYEHNAHCPQFAPDGQRIVTVSEAATAHIWDANTGRELAILRGHEAGVLSAQFAPDGHRLVTASRDYTARIWDVNTGRELAVLHGHEGSVWSAQFAPDGRRVATASWDNTARIWDADTGRELAILRGHEGPVWTTRFSPDSRRIVTASYDTTARIWDVETGRALTVLKGHSWGVNDAQFAPDGRRIVTTSVDDTQRIWIESGFFTNDSQDNTVRIWDVNTGRELWALRRHEGVEHGAQFAPDGRRLLTASADNTACIWDVGTGRTLSILRGHQAPIYGAQFSPDGRRIVTCSDDGTARIYLVYMEDLIALAKSRASRELTSEERETFLRVEGDELLLPNS